MTCCESTCISNTEPSIYRSQALFTSALLSPINFSFKMFFQIFPIQKHFTPLVSRIFKSPFFSPLILFLWNFQKSKIKKKFSTLTKKTKSEGQTPTMKLFTIVSFACSYNIQTLGLTRKHILSSSTLLLIHG